jgi:hypothetical protein
MAMASKVRKRSTTGPSGFPEHQIEIAKAKLVHPWEIQRQITIEDKVAKFVSILWIIWASLSGLIILGASL